MHPPPNRHHRQAEAGIRRLREACCGVIRQNASCTHLCYFLYAPTALHRPGDVVHLVQRSVAAHELVNVKGFVSPLQDLESEVVGAAEGKGGLGRGQEKGVMKRLEVRECMSAEATPPKAEAATEGQRAFRLTSLTIFISIACLKGTLMPNALRWRDCCSWVCVVAHW